ncbi:MAG: Zn-ribbon domain-containing OB-fold protein [Congregibacter sp.]|nr:Zn-ribbon domain-containing OB-fold protein [Congregibacter sp.]
MLRTQPTRSALSEPWFEACNDGRLLIQRCDACGNCQFYPRLVCTNCVSPDLQWCEVSGEAVLASFTVVRHAISTAYDAPYVVALVDLEEGPRLMSNIIHCDLEQLRIGARLKLQFQQWDEDVSLPVFVLDSPELMSRSDIAPEAKAP